MASRMGKSLAVKFCDFVSGPGLPYYREFIEWADAEYGSRHRAFWSELALRVRDCGHEHSAYVLYRMADVFACRLAHEQEFIGKVGDVFSECVERFGIHEDYIRKEDEQCAPTEA